MFFDIGEKIKVLAKVMCCVGILASVVLGVSLSSIDAPFVLIGIIIIIIGSIISWISCFFIYGFGELISLNERQLIFLSKINNDINEINKQIKTIPEKEKTQKTESTKNFIKNEKTDKYVVNEVGYFMNCSVCDNSFIVVEGKKQVICPKCNTVHKIED